jgi:hypothetical protein
MVQLLLAEEVEAEVIFLPMRQEQVEMVRMVK